MDSLTALAQSLGLAYASGISPYATVTLLGLLAHAGWIGALPGALEPLTHPIVLIVAGALAVMEFVALLIPGVASAWEATHSVIRPPAAAALAVATAWHADPALIAVAGLLGGGLGLATHLTKLGVRLTVDASPEPVSNGVVTTAEIGLVASVAYFAWEHPLLTLAGATLLLVGTMLLVRVVWRRVRATVAEWGDRAVGAVRSR